MGSGSCGFWGGCRVLEQGPGGLGKGTGSTRVGLGSAGSQGQRRWGARGGCKGHGGAEGPVGVRSGAAC